MVKSDRLTIENPLTAAILLSVFVLIQFQNLTGLSLTVDDQDAIFRNFPAVWLLQGRWGAFIVEYSILSLPVITFIPLIILGICSVISYLIMCKIVGKEDTDWPVVIVFGIFVASPQWIFIIEFSPNNAAMGIGMVFAALAGLVFREISQPMTSAKSYIAGVSAAAILLCMTASLYQAFFVVALVISSFSIVISVLNGFVSVSRAVMMHALLIVSALLGYVAWQIVGEILIDLYRLERINFYAESFVNLSAVLSNPWPGFALAWKSYVGLVWGLNDFYGSKTWGFGLILAFSSFMLAASAFHRGIAAGVFVTFWIILANVSIVLFQITGGGQYIPYRVMTVFPAISALLMIFIVSHGSKWLTRLVIAMSTIAIFQGSVVFNRAASAYQLMAAKDSFIAGSLFERVAAIGTADQYGRYKIEIEGSIPSASPYPMPASSHMAISWFDQEPYEFRAVEYMRALGYPVVSERDSLRFENQFSSMPNWPQDGSIIAVRDTVLIKLGD